MTTTDTTTISGEHWLSLANDTQDPLECIAMALTGLLAVQVKAADAASSDDMMVTQLEASTETVTELAARLDAVREVVGKSTAGWADKIRDAIGDTEAAPEPQAEEPISG